MLEAALEGAAADGIADVDVVVRPALVASAADALAADAYLLGTPANLGYISGALKHFFDLVYYPCLGASARRPFGAYVHGDSDTTGATAAIDKITTGMAWRKAADYVTVTGAPNASDIEACWNLGAVVAALAMESS